MDEGELNTDTAAAVAVVPLAVVVAVAVEVEETELVGVDAMDTAGDVKTATIVTAIEEGWIEENGAEVVIEMIGI